MNDPALYFCNGLIWYLQTRNWALEKIRECPRGAHPFDVRIHHQLYFVSLLSAIDHVHDYLKRSGYGAFRSEVKQSFGATQNYEYIRKLRDSIIHRGFDPTMAGHADETKLYVLCPSEVHDEEGKNSYTCTFKYLVELANHCNITTNPIFAATLEKLGLFSVERHIVPLEDAVEEMKRSTVMPDWAKELGLEAFQQIDHAVVAEALARSRVNQMRQLLEY